MWGAKWELALPVVVVVAIFSGYSTPVEAAALAAVYALVVQCFVHRDVGMPKPANTRSVREASVKRRPHRQRDVFDGVVIIDV